MPIRLCDLTPEQLISILEDALETGTGVHHCTFRHTYEKWAWDWRKKYADKIAESQLLKAYFSVRHYEDDNEDYQSTPLPCEGELHHYHLWRTHGNWEDYHDTCGILFMHCSEVGSIYQSNTGMLSDWGGFGFKSRHPIQTLQKFVPNGYVLKEA